MSQNLPILAAHFMRFSAKNQFCCRAINFFCRTKLRFLTMLYCIHLVITEIIIYYEQCCIAFGRPTLTPYLCTELLSSKLLYTLHSKQAFFSLYLFVNAILLKKL